MVCPEPFTDTNPNVTLTSFVGNTTQTSMKNCFLTKPKMFVMADRIVCPKVNVFQRTRYSVREQQPEKLLMGSIMNSPKTLKAREQSFVSNYHVPQVTKFCTVKNRRKSHQVCEAILLQESPGKEMEPNASVVTSVESKERERELMWSENQHSTRRVEPQGSLPKVLKSVLKSKPNKKINSDLAMLHEATHLKDSVTTLLEQPSAQKHHTGKLAVNQETSSVEKLKKTLEFDSSASKQRTSTANLTKNFRLSQSRGILRDLQTRSHRKKMLESFDR
jgi:hypothetical protein